MLRRMRFLEMGEKGAQSRIPKVSLCAYFVKVLEAAKQFEKGLSEFNLQSDISRHFRRTYHMVLGEKGIEKAPVSKLLSVMSKLQGAYL